MKILSDPENWSKETICNCEAKLEIDLSDLMYEEHYDGNTIYYCCPLCHNNVMVDVPPYIAQRVNKYLYND